MPSFPLYLHNGFELSHVSIFMGDQPTQVALWDTVPLVTSVATEEFHSICHPLLNQSCHSAVGYKYLLA